MRARRRGMATAAIAPRMATAATTQPAVPAIGAGRPRAAPPVAPGRMPVAAAMPKRAAIGTSPSSDSATIVPASVS